MGRQYEGENILRRSKKRRNMRSALESAARGIWPGGVVWLVPLTVTDSERVGGAGSVDWTRLGRLLEGRYAIRVTPRVWIKNAGIQRTWSRAAVQSGLTGPRSAGLRIRTAHWV